MARGSRRARGRSVQGRQDHYPAVPAVGDLFADPGTKPVPVSAFADHVAWAIALHDPDACPYCSPERGTSSEPCPESDR